MRHVSFADFKNTEGKINWDAYRIAEKAARQADIADGVYCYKCETFLIFGRGHGRQLCHQCRGLRESCVESVWAVLKRGIHGVYHQVSAKHLFRYIDEFTFRLNEGNVERHALQRLDSFVDGIAGKRLTYARLIEWELYT